MEYSKAVTEGVNRLFGAREPWQVAAITATTVLSAVWLWNLVDQEENVWERGKKKFFRLVRRLPQVRRKIEEQLNITKLNFQDQVSKVCQDLHYAKALPRQGVPKDEVFQLVDKHLKIGKYNWKEGRVSGAVYVYREDLVDLITTVYSKASYTNPLHPDIFPGVCKMETDVVRMACDLFHGGAEACGTMTSGGTESILMACKAYRDFMRETKGITTPNMLVPRTVHAAFDKAAQYFNIHIKYIDVDPETYTVDVKKMKRAITKNTILLVGSAPNFPYGTLDNIEEIAALGVKYKIPVHVDACLGSFLIALMPEAGYSVPPFDFRVKGVTSMSADAHKYGFAPKGCSLILYSDQKYLDYQFSVTTDWPGGVYGSPTVSGSRAGGIIAACWATMMYYGRDGYLEATKRIVDTSRYIENSLRKLPGVFIFGTPTTSVIAVGSKVFDALRLASDLGALGWNLNHLQFPSGVHICVTDMHTAPGVADKFIADFTAAVTEIMKDPGHPVEGKMAVYGMAQEVPDRSIVGEFTRCFINSMYYSPPEKEQNNKH